MTLIDDDWEAFLMNDHDENQDRIIENNNVDKNTTIPKSSDLYISTKTKILFVNCCFDLNDIFWKLPIMDYCVSKEGIIKKQMKFNSTTKEELDIINTNKVKYKCCNENIIYNSDSVHMRDNKFKDVRKISIGVSKKDIMSYRSKEKSAFYNCFVINIRIIDDDIFKEVHVKIFNTGKMEIPGIQCENLFAKIKQKILEILQPYVDVTLKFDDNKEETVLVNSNFHCGYYLNRDALFELLKYKYNIQASYDPCSYPGIQCKYIISNDNKYISFMIFRTGSILIVGKCDDTKLNEVYEYLKKLMYDEYSAIHIKQEIDQVKINKPKKTRKKIIYFNSVTSDSITEL